MNKILRSGLLTVVTLLFVFCMGTKAKAEEFVEIEPYELNKFEDIYNFADYATPIVSEDGEYRGLFKVEIKERGLLYFSNYSSRQCNGMWDGWTDPYYPIGVYAYKSQNMLSTLDQQGRWQERLNGSTFTSKYDFLYYVMPGTYYIEIKTLKTGDKNLVFAGFLSDSKVLKIEDIEVLDSGKAVVKFNDIGTYSKAYIAEGDMLDLEWSTSSEWVSIYQSNSNSTGLVDNAFEVNGNGTYTLYVSKTVTPHNNLAATSEWTKTPLMVTFKVEKVEVLAKKLKMSKTKLSMKIGDSISLTAKITPENVTDSTIKWKSSNKKIAT
ncbi:MAG: Ig-like domain-containing protein, partial [Lachnospiraceae bacterium]|nr:Ig-like domain-containing protein [Lachnospiraceae bacterium]